MRLNVGFSNKEQKNSYYDIKDDWALIEASLAKQYGIRIRNERDMSWDEFCTLVSGLLPDTPLGQVVGIRAEKDPKVIKAYTPEQKRIHYEWKRKQARQLESDPEKLNKNMETLYKTMKTLFGGGEKSGKQ